MTGKQALFAEAWMILMAVEEHPTKVLNAHEAKLLGEAAEAMHEADGWRRFATLGHGVGEDAKETYAILARIPGAVRDGDVWTGFWGKVHSVEATLKSLADGGKPNAQQLKTAREICLKASNQGPITAPLRRVR